MTAETKLTLPAHTLESAPGPARAVLEKAKAQVGSMFAAYKVA
jgi:hypothetical protein